MASQHPQASYNGQPGYDRQQSEQYDANQQDGNGNPSPAQGAGPAAPGAGKKKRHYAGQAYEFGGGANAALGGQQVAGGQYPPPPGQGYGGYGQQPQPGQQQAGYSGGSYGSGPVSPAVGGTPGYGQQPPAVGGYQPPEPGYPSHGAPAAQPGIGGITQGMGAMTMGNQPQHQQLQAQQMQGRMPMNQLYPTDILNVPLNVAELDLPPPPIILPQNVSLCPV